MWLIIISVDRTKKWKEQKTRLPSATFLEVSSDNFDADEC